MNSEHKSDCVNLAFLLQKKPVNDHQILQVPTEIVLNAVVRRNTHMSANERKRAQMQVLKRAQKSASA